MSNIPTSRTTVLISGAGPVGLTLACELQRRGVPFRLIDRALQPADTFDVPRTTLDRLAGYPVAEAPHPLPRVVEDATELAELAAYEAHFRQMLEEQIPRPLWRAYMDACDALADALSESYRTAREQEPPAGPEKEDRDLGFRRRPGGGRRFK